VGLKNWFLKKALNGKLPLWIYRLAGRKLAKTLWEEKKMADSVEKPWYKSKAKVGAILMAILAAVQPVTTAFGHPIQVPLWVYEFLAGLGIYGVRNALNK
jgi:hypothetical protein